MHNLMRQSSVSIFNVQICWTLLYTVYAVKAKTCGSELIFICKQEIPLKIVVGIELTPKLHYTQ